MKPDNALSLPVNCSLSQVGTEDALCSIGFNPISTGYLFELRYGGKYNQMRASEVGNWLIKLFDNVAVTVVFDSEYTEDEWMITDIASGRCVHSYGV